VPVAARVVQPLRTAVGGPALLGPRAAGIARLAALGLPVCDGAVVTTDACRAYRRDGRVPGLVRGELAEAITRLERGAGRRFGVDDDPLVLELSVDEVGDVGEVGAGAGAIEQLHGALRAAWAVAPADAPIAVCLYAGETARAGSGVAYTRDPATGSPGSYGWFAAGAEPESLRGLADRAPDAFAALEAALPLVEAEFADMCAVEFTVADGELRLLGAQPGRRSATAAVRIAVDLVDEGLIRIPDAVERVPLAALDELDAGQAYAARLLRWFEPDAARR
jgi:pyruvate,orthophosphate dikinase